MQTEVHRQEALASAALPLGNPVEPKGIDIAGGQSAGEIALAQRLLALLVRPAGLVRQAPARGQADGW